MSQTLQEERRVDGKSGPLPHWMMNIPFVLLHLSMVTVFLVPFTWVGALAITF
jgi:hypothetical protein